MENSTVQLMDLPDELLLMIFKHLNNREMLLSLMGVHVRLDEIISDPIFTKCLTLTRLSKANLICPMDPLKLDRFCTEILPRIAEQVKWINIDASSMESVLLAEKYPNLFGIGIYNITEEKFQRVLLGKKFLVRILSIILTSILKFI